EERRLLDDIVADVDDQVGVVDRTVQEVVIRQRGAAQIQRMLFIDDALAHLCREERDGVLGEELAERLRRGLAVRGGADHQQRPPRLCYCGAGGGDRLVLGDRAAYVAGLDWPRA